MASFFNTYYNEIKSNFSHVDINELSSLLSITPEEIHIILDSKNIESLSSEVIPTVMLNGSSYICRIFKKSLSYYNSKTYSPRDIAYNSKTFPILR